MLSDEMFIRVEYCWYDSHGQRITQDRYYGPKKGGKGFERYDEVIPHHATGFRDHGQACKAAGWFLNMGIGEDAEVVWRDEA